MKVKKKVPELRFSGFSGEWEEKRLGDVAEDISYGMNVPAKKFDGKNKYIRITDIDEVTNNYIDKDKVSPDGELDCKFLLKEGDIVFARTGASTGKTYYYKKKDGRIYFAGFLIRIRVDNKNDYKYIFYNTLTEKYNKWVKVMSIRSGQPGINATEYASYRIHFPSLPEQQKIGNFFFTLDKRIELQQQKVENLEKEKKWIMQKIFSQEIRFKDENGNDYPEWEKKRLGDLCKITTGKLDANAMVEDGKYKFFTCAREDYYIDDYAFNTEALIAAGNGDIGHIKYYKGKFNAYQRTYVLDDFTQNILFVKNYMDLFFKQWILKEVQMGSMPYIKLKTLTDFKIRLPQIEEQQKIADFLSTFDNKIEKEREKLEQLRELKRGLLQKMFV